ETKRSATTLDCFGLLWIFGLPIGLERLPQRSERESKRDGSRAAFRVANMVNFHFSGRLVCVFKAKLSEKNDSGEGGQKLSEAPMNFKFCGNGKVTRTPHRGLVEF